MKVNELAQKMSLTLLAGEGGLNNEVCCGYSGDLLSWVMGRAKEGSAWVTVMGNINAIAVATLADCACIILSDNASLDEDARKKAESQNIPVLSTSKNSYETSVEIFKLLKA